MRKLIANLSFGTKYMRNILLIFFGLPVKLEND